MLVAVAVLLTTAVMRLVAGQVVEVQAGLAARTLPPIRRVLLALRAKGTPEEARREIANQEDAAVAEQATAGLGTPAEAATVVAATAGHPT